MQKGKDFQSFDMLFPSIAVYVDKVSGYEIEPKLTEICKLYSELVVDLCLNTKLHEMDDKWIVWMKNSSKSSRRELQHYLKITATLTCP